MASRELGEILQLLREIKGELSALSKANVHRPEARPGPSPKEEAGSEASESPASINWKAIVLPMDDPPGEFDSPWDGRADSC
jgi:hypothetical protein